MDASRYFGTAGAAFSGLLADIVSEIRLHNSIEGDIDVLKALLNDFNAAEEFEKNFYEEIYDSVQNNRGLSVTILDSRGYQGIQQEDILNKIKRDNGNLDLLILIYYLYGIGDAGEGLLKPGISATILVIDLRNDKRLTREETISTSFSIQSHSFSEYCSNGASLYRDHFRKVSNNFGGVFAINNL